MVSDLQRGCGESERETTDGVLIEYYGGDCKIPFSKAETRGSANSLTGFLEGMAPV